MPKDERIVRYRLESLPKGQTDWQRVDKLTDAEIEAAIRDDPDGAPICDEAWFDKAELVIPAHLKRLWVQIDEDLLEFTRRLIHLQASHPAFRRRGWFNGRSVRGSGVRDIAWFRPDGREMADEDWQQARTNSFAVFLNGDALRELDDDGRPVRDDSFLLLFNPHHEPVRFTLPAASFGRRWNVITDTEAGLRLTPRTLNAEETLAVADRTILVLSRASSAWQGDVV